MKHNPLSFGRGTGEPSADGPFQLGVELGDAVLDGDSLGPAAVEELPRGDAQLAGKVLHFDALLGHRRILSYSGDFGEGIIEPEAPWRN